MTQEHVEISDAELAARALLRVGESCRNDLALFYETVIKHETKFTPLIPAPHQRLMFSFAQHHPWCVIRIPVGMGKTFSTGAFALWKLGNDKTRRTAIVSATINQSKKILKMVSDYIVDPQLNAPLTLAFPWLRKTIRGEAWTVNQITVDRPPGIRDPSMIAVGFDVRIHGARLSGAVADDVVDDQNTRTPASRDALYSAFENRILSRMDPTDTYVIVCNTPWHRDDLTFRLENKGYPTITMDIYGYVRISNAEVSWMSRATEEFLRPSKTRVGGAHHWYRLKAYDPDPKEEIPLWPERMSLERINELRYGKDGKGAMAPFEFSRLYLCQPLDEDAARCQREWIEKCKFLGVGLPIGEEYDGDNPTYTGVDLGVGKGHKHDKTTFFTAEFLPDGTRRILDVDSGKMSGPEIIAKIIEKTDRFQSVIAVETNAAQDYIRQFALEQRKDLKIHAHSTQSTNKHNMDFGVESIFTEIQNGGWIIPCDRNGKTSKGIQAWIDDCLYYQPPPAHTGDFLIASWICRERGRKTRRNDPPAWSGKKRTMASTGNF